MQKRERGRKLVYRKAFLLMRSRGIMQRNGILQFLLESLYYRMTDSVLRAVIWC